MGALPVEALRPVEVKFGDDGTHRGTIKHSVVT